MGEAARRKDLVDDVRKKIGEQAATAVATLDDQVNKLHLANRAFVFEVEGLRRECAMAKAAPAELRRDVYSFKGDLAMKAEQLENLGMRVQGLSVDLIGLGGAAVEERKDIWEAIDHLGEDIYTIRYNAAAEFWRVRRLERLTFWQRLRFLVTGGLPTLPAEIPQRTMSARVAISEEDIAASKDAPPGTYWPPKETING